MSMKTNILLDKEFALSQDVSSSSCDMTQEYPFRVAANRRNRKAKKPFWDLNWDSALSHAIHEAEAEHIYVNGGVFFRTKEMADKVKARAEKLWLENSPNR